MSKFLSSGGSGDLTTLQNGTFDADLSSVKAGSATITGDISCANLTVTDTATIQTLITHQELEIKDTLITCGVDNPADLSNLGLLEQYNNGVSDRWAGLVRSKDNGEHYILRDEATKPTPTDDIRPFSLGLLGSINANEMKCDVLRADNAIFAENGVVLNAGASPWIIDKAPGLDGQVLSYDAGTDQTKWIAAGSGPGGSQTMQQTFDLSSAPQLTTDATNQSIVFKRGGTSGSVNTLVIRDSGDVDQIFLQNNGTVRCVDTESQTVSIQNGAATRWTMSLDSENLLFQTNTALQAMELDYTTGVTTINKGLVVGEGGTEYTMPSARGTLDQVLQTDAAGIVTWQTLATAPSTMQEIYDASTGPQLLTTSGDPTFQIKQGDVLGVPIVGKLFEILDNADVPLAFIDNTGMTIAGTLTAGTSYLSGLVVGSNPTTYAMPTARGTLDQILKTDAAGIVTWQDIITPTMQDVFDTSAGPQLITTVADPTMLIKRGAGVAGNIFEVQDSAGGVVLSAESTAGVFGNKLQTPVSVLTDITKTAKWLTIAEPTVSSHQLKNESNQVVRDILQTGEVTFRVSDTDVANIDAGGLSLVDGLKTSAFVHEIRGAVPAIPATLTWVNRPEYAGQITFISGDTLVDFDSTVEQRSVETVEYVVLGKMDIGSSVDLTVQLASVVGNDIMLGVQFTDDSEQVLGSQVGTAQSQYYMLVTKAGDISYMFEAGIQTVAAAPNINAIANTYDIFLARSGVTTWQISFQQGATPISTTISLSGEEWGCRHAQFLIGDKSNVVSSFSMTNQITDSTNYNSAGDPELYTLEQKNNKMAILDEGGHELIDIACSRVEINQPLTANRIKATDINATSLATQVMTLTGSAPDAATLQAGLWDFDGILPVNITQTSPTVADFNAVSEIRSLTSKAYIVPGDIAVGGYVEWDASYSNLNLGKSMVIGTAFKNSNMVFSGFSAVTGKDENYTLFRTPANSILIEGSIGGSQLPNFNPNVGIIHMRCTRTSAALWTLSWASTISGVRSELSLTTTFGPEKAQRFIYLAVGLFTLGLNTMTISISNFTYNLWEPGSFDYTLVQDAENAISCNLPDGSAVWAAGPNDYRINKPLVTTNSICCNSSLFGFPCCVSSTFYRMCKGPTIVGPTGEIDISLSIRDTAWGGRNIPRIFPGVSYRVRAQGIVTTQDNAVLEIKLKIGGVIMAETTSIKKLKKNVSNRTWSLEIEVVPTVADLVNDESDCESTGMFRWVAQDLETDTIEGLAIYSQAPVPVPFNNPGDMVLTAEWVAGADPGCSLAVSTVSYSFEGFNL